MEGKTAILFGAKGLTGTYLLEELVNSDNYIKIKIPGRNKKEFESDKIESFVINFNKLDDYSELIKGDDLFCCLGTTVKNAGSQEATRVVDFDYPVKIAKIAERNRVKSFIVVSSLGANPNSTSFYLKSKGMMEVAIKDLNFESLHTLRPSMLLGERNEFRFGEVIGKVFILLFGWLMFGKIKAL
ncbi:NAD(P)H-binding protein [Bacteroidota bacterium]